MRYLQKKHLLAQPAMIALLLVGAAAAPIYTSDFESFTTGSDKLADNQGWRGSFRGQSLHGIDEDVIPGLGKTGYIGRNQPASPISFVNVWRPVNYDPIANDNPVVEFFAVIGVADSSNGERDNFYISFYDIENRLIGAVNFDNTNDRFGIWRYDGQAYTASTTRFVRGRVHELYIRINYATSRWSAELDFLPIFRDAPIDFSGKSKTIGSFAAEWEISDDGNPGDNWLLFDEWSVNASPPPALPTPKLESVVGDMMLAWDAEAGYGYRVERSTDLKKWAPVTTVTPDERGDQIVDLDQDSSNSSGYFRLVRFEPPPDAQSPISSSEPRETPRH